MDHPILKSRGALITYIAIWTVIGVFHFSLFYLAYGVDLNSALADSIVSTSIFAFLILRVCTLAKYFPLSWADFYRFAITQVAAALIISAIWIAVTYMLVFFVVVKDDSFERFFVNTLIWRVFIGMLLYTAIIFFNYLLVLYNSYIEKSAREAELNALIREAELKNLKFQINPHFIFNSLNSISSLTMINPEKAREMIVKLSEFIRYSVSQGDKKNSILRDELNNVRRYLDIEKIRFGEKFEVTENITDECLKIPMPNMLLQPLFENAIKHGVFESIDKVNIKFDCEKKEGFLHIAVENNYDPDSVPAKGSGIGLNNIKNRLKLIYKRDDLIVIKKEKEKFLVDIYIPAEENEN
jgi:sensor histidine kinase YesM